MYCHRDEFTNYRQTESNPIRQRNVSSVPVKYHGEVLVKEALKRASYSIVEDDEPYYGEIEDLPGI